MGQGLKQQLERAQRKNARLRRDLITMRLNDLNVHLESPAALVVYEDFQPTNPDDYTHANIADFIVEAFPPEETP